MQLFFLPFFSFTSRSHFKFCLFFIWIDSSGLNGFCKHICFDFSNVFLFKWARWCWCQLKDLSSFALISITFCACITFFWQACIYQLLCIIWSRQPQFLRCIFIFCNIIRFSSLFFFSSFHCIDICLVDNKAQTFLQLKAPMIYGAVAINR